MRRIFLIAIIILVLGLIGGGAALLVNYNSAPKVLMRANIALSSGLHAEALQQAEKYIQKSPDDFQGYFIKGRAANRLGRYADARQALNKALRLQPDNVDIQLEIAAVYSLEAQPVTLLQNRAPTIAQHQNTLNLLNEAAQVISRIQPKNDADRLAVLQSQGLNLAEISRTKAACARLLQAEAARLRDSAPEAADQKQQQADQYRNQADADADEAIRTLTALIRDDNQNPAAATLVELCLDSDDAETLHTARKLIMDQPSPPALAAALLLRADLKQSLDETDPQQRSKRVAEIAATLDQVIQRHPDNLHILLARAEAAMLMTDWETARRMVDKVLEIDAAHREGRLLLGQVLINTRQFVEAEKILRTLATEARQSAVVHFFYARAARGAGFHELAMSSMRTAIELQPDYLAPRLYVIERLLESNRPDLAFTEAEQARRFHPNQPQAIQAFLKAAIQLDRQDAARDLLQQLQDQETLTPEMMRVIAYGYSHLDNNKANAEALAALARRSPSSLNGQLARALALDLDGRRDEAIDVLQKSCRQFPTAAEPRVYLAKMHIAQRSPMQAAELLREALAINPDDIETRLTLARLHYQNGMLNDCRLECDEILRRAPQNVNAAILVNQLRIIRNEPIDIDTLQADGDRRRLGVALAQAYLVADQPQKAIEVCLAELEKKPDIRARQLLALAYRQTGRTDKCIQQWAEMLCDDPDDVSIYMQLLQLYLHENSIRQAEELLAQTPGAHDYLVRFTLAWHHSRSARHDLAARYYSAAIATTGIPDELADRARLWRARSLAALRDYDRALTDLRSLAQKPLWRKSASFARAQVLVAAGRHDEAATILTELAENALKDDDRPLLRNIVEFHAQAGRIQQALDLCDRMNSATDSSDISTLLLKAAVLSLDGRMDEAVELHKQARDMQPGNLNVHRLLALSLELSNHPDQAIQCLNRMRQLGDSADATATLELGRLYSRRGLQQAALDEFQKLAAAGHDDPQLRLSVAQALGILGQKEQAQSQLRTITRHSRYYLQAQMLIAKMTDDLTRRAEILDQLAKLYPTSTQLLAQQVATLLLNDQPDEALKRLRTFAGDATAGDATDNTDGGDTTAITTAANNGDDDAGGKGSRIVPGEIARLVVQRLIEKNLNQQAAQLAVEMFDTTRQDQWRRLACVLLAETDRTRAEEMLPNVDRAELLDCLIGLWLQGRHADKAAEWNQRISAAGAPIERLALHDRLLIALAAGNVNQARRLTREAPQLPIVIDPLNELIDHTEKNGPDEAAELLGARLARLMYLTPLDVTRAMNVLRQRPQSLIAAEMIAVGNAQLPDIRQAHALARPTDSTAARRLQAIILQADGKPRQAADLLGKLAQENQNYTLLQYQQAKTLEKAGWHKEAVAIYRSIAARDSRLPQAANDAAYLICLLHHDSPDDLAEARKLIDAAIAAGLAAQPQQPDTGRTQTRIAPALLDTRGWIACLQNDGPAALNDLRTAIRGLPENAQVHAHVAYAEARWGNPQLAQLHAQTAIDLAAQDKQANQDDLIGNHAATVARQTLARLEESHQ